MTAAVAAPPRFHRLTVREVRRETPDAVSIVLAVPERLREAYRFRPGQHLTLRARIDAEEVRRSYSICSGPDEGELRVAVKRHPGGVFSAFADERLRPGDELDVMTPAGRFTLPPPEPGAEPAAAPPRCFLAVAAGSGITPILAIVKAVLAREPLSRVALLYGNRDSRSILFKGELEDLKDRFLGRLAVLHVLSREGGKATCRCSRGGSTRPRSWPSSTTSCRPARSTTPSCAARSAWSRSPAPRSSAAGCRGRASTSSCSPPPTRQGRCSPARPAPRWSAGTRPGHPSPPTTTPPRRS
jgi:ferredoxin-NADP reductase